MCPEVETKDDRRADARQQQQLCEGGSPPAPRCETMLSEVEKVSKEEGGTKVNLEVEEVSKEEGVGEDEPLELGVVGNDSALIETSKLSKKKVKKLFFYFFTYCVKNILFLIIFGFGPLTPSIN